LPDLDQHVKDYFSRENFFYTCLHLFRSICLKQGYLKEGYSAPMILINAPFLTLLKKRSTLKVEHRLGLTVADLTEEYLTVINTLAYYAKALITSTLS
jgi:hypothetical protein